MLHSLRLEQWPALLALARAVDLNRTSAMQSPKRATGWVTLELLRAMLTVNDAHVCMALLLELPELLDALPMDGYLMLLQALDGEVKLDTQE